MAKEMEGGNRQRREKAKEARERGESASEAGVSFGASKQRSETNQNDEHAREVDHMRRGKRDQTLTENTPDARPGSRPTRND
jgi:hypothetical protein